MLKPRSRRFGLMLSVGACTALSLLSSAGSASALCADPRGDSYCSNGGQVTFSQPAPAQVPSAPAQVTSQTSQAPAQPAPVSSSSPAVQTNAPAAANASISIDPPLGGPGDSITVSGQGLGGGRAVWINLAGTPLGAKQLATVDGSTPSTAANGSLSSTLVIPDLPDWAAGDAQICVIAATPQPVCADFTVQGNGDDASAGPADTSSTGGVTTCYSCGVIDNNGARLFGQYNSGSGHYEYHGAHP